jgi:hypothetical protein
VLDRQLCRGASSAAVNPCSSSAYATFFYDSYDNSSNSSATFPTGCSAPSGSYASDPVGQTTAEVFSNQDASGWRCYGYDQRSQLDQSSLSVTASGTTTTQTINLNYNNGGEVTGLVYPDGETLTATYDVNGRFQTSYFGTSASPITTKYYTASGKQIAMKQGNAFYYLAADLLGGISVVFKNDGSFQASQLFAP